MRILFLTPQLPYPPRQGTALRNWGLISGLAGRHEIWLLSFDEAGAARGQTDGFVAPLRDACARIAAFPIPPRTTRSRLRTLLSSRLPDMAWRLWSPDFAAQFNDWVGHNPFDIVQIEGIELARYALESPISNPQSPIPIVFDDHNCEYLLQRRAYEVDRWRPARWHAAAYSSVQWRRLRAFERRIVRAARATLCVSAQDAAAIQRIEPPARPHVIVNGIHVRAYSEYRQQTRDDGRRTTDDGRREGQTLVFTGKMDFRWNVDAMLWFGREVMPLVRQQIPEVQLLIVGQRPSPRLDVLRADPAITITGAVDDAREYIARSDVYVAPLRVGSGTRFKLLEAMSMRRAIVSTALGCEGFEVRDGQELLIADQPADFAAAVVRLLRDPQLRATMGERGLAFAAAQYDWSVIVPRLERIYGEIRART